MVVGCFDCDCGLVSVIIAAYNVEAYINECIESLLNQTYKNIEIIVCDDCSTDKTLEILLQYKDIPFLKVISNDSNKKQAYSRNKCINLSRGKYILIQDADDLSEPTRIEKLIAAFENEIDFVGSSCYCFNDKGVFDSIQSRTRYPQKGDLLKGISFIHASMMFRRTALQGVNGYRVSKHTTRIEDYDLILRLYACGYKGKNIPDFLYGYRVNADNISRRSFANRIDECLIRFEGFKANGLLLPFGWMYVLKPFPAYLYQFIKYWKILSSGQK